MNLKTVLFVLVGIFFAELYLLTFTLSRASGQPILNGGATMNNGQISLVSNSSSLYSSVSLPVSADMRFTNLLNLSATYQAVTGSNCGFGSPSFQIFLDTGNGSLSNITVKIDPTLSAVPCPVGWQNTGNLVTDLTLRVNAVPIGGLYNDTFAHAISLAPDAIIKGINFVLDGSAVTDFPQSFLIRSLAFNDSVYSFEPVPTPTPIPTVVLSPTPTPVIISLTKDDCKKDGWKLFIDPVFKNQGACVSYFEHLKKGDDRFERDLEGYKKYDR